MAPCKEQILPSETHNLNTVAATEVRWQLYICLIFYIYHKMQTQIKAAVLLFILLCLFIGSAKVTAQHQNTYDMAPICNQELQVRAFFQEYLPHLQIEAGHDLIIVHMKAGSCPRCEGVILNEAAQFKSFNYKTVLILDGTKKQSSEQYIESYLAQSNLRPDYIVYDTLTKFREFIDYKRTSLNVPYIYKIALNSGYFLSIIPSLGTNFNNSLTDSIVHAKTRLQCIDASSQETVYKCGFNSIWSSETPLDKVGADKFREAMSIALANDTLSILDAASDKLIFFNARNGKFLFETLPNEEEYYFLSKDTLQAAAIRRLKSKRTARVIYLKHFKKNGHIQVVASVPNVRVEVNKNDTDIYYYNGPIIIEKDLNGKNVSWRQIGIDKGGLHSGYTDIGQTGYYLVGKKKGFPAVGTSYNPADTANDPFVASFYEHTPTFLLYKDGKFINGLGSLPEYYKEKRLGYYYLMFLPAHNDKYIFIISQATGEVYAYSFDGLDSKKTPFWRGNLMPDKKLTFSAEIGEDKMAYFDKYMEQMCNYYLKSAFSTKEFLYTCVVNNLTNQVTIRKHRIDREFKIEHERVFQASDVRSITNTFFYQADEHVYLGALESCGADYKWGQLRVD